MKKRWLAILLVALTSAAPLRAAEIAVFAAASLMDSLKEIGAAYEKTTSDKVLFNFAASSTLARQIEEGAPADIFFSADEAQMDALDKKQLLLAGTRKSRLSNLLVIVVAKDGATNIHSPQDLAGDRVKKIALADPKAVPAGVYSKEYLEKTDLWTVIEPKVVPTENVRAALAAVESGNVEAGMVYRTDAAQSAKIKIAFEVPVADGPNISYPLAVLKESKQAGAAKKFAEYLSSDEAGKVFESRGFIVLK